MERDNSHRRLLEERERERSRQEQRREAERSQQEDRLRALEGQRERLRGQREATQEQARRVQQGREEAQARTATERAAGRALANERRTEREEELKRVQLDREVRRRAVTGDRPHTDEAQKTALEYDMYRRNNLATRENLSQRASHLPRQDAELASRARDAAATHGDRVFDQELLRHRAEQARASVERTTLQPKPRAWLLIVVSCAALVAALVAAYAINKW